MCREGYTKPLYLEIRTIECFYRRINRPSCVNVKIAFILNDTSPTNGATKAFLLLLQGLRIRGVQPHVVVPDKNGIYQELKVSKGVSIIALDYRPCAYPRLTVPKDYLLFIPKLLGRIIVNTKAVRSLSAYLKTHQIDIVHTNVGVIDIGYRAALRCHLPHLFHIREYGNRIGLHFFPTTASYLKKVTGDKTYSICITKCVQEFYGLNGNTRSRVIYDCIPSKKGPMPRQSSRKFFLYAGRIEANKGLDQLLEAYDSYLRHTQEPIPLYIAGSSDDKPYLSVITQYIESHHMGSHLHFLGNIHDLDTFMREALALIVPSRYEGFGLCLAEAMQNGCLTIGHNTTGTKEQFDNGLEVEGQEIGLRYETTEQLANLLTEVSNHPVSHYDTYRERAFHIVNEHYTTELHIGQVFAFYQDIINQICRLLGIISA